MSLECALRLQCCEVAAMLDTKISRCKRNQRIRDLKIRIEFITASIMLRIKLWAAMRIEKQEFVTLQHI